MNVYQWLVCRGWRLVSDGPRWKYYKKSNQYREYMVGVPNTTNTNIYVVRTR